MFNVLMHTNYGNLAICVPSQESKQVCIQELVQHRSALEGRLRQLQQQVGWTALPLVYCKHVVLASGSFV